MLHARTMSAIAIAAVVLGPGLQARPAFSLAPDVRVPASGLHWRNIGPFRAGRVGAVAGAIGQPGVFYIGLPFGGVWKTTSAGTTWFPVFDAVTEISSIASLAVAPSDPDIVYAGTGDPYRATYRGNGLYKSTDAGKTWRHLPLGDTKVVNILVDPRNPNLVVAAALGNVQTKSDVRGVFRSTDGGATWTRTLFVDDETGVSDVAAAFDEPNVVFAVTSHYYTPEPGGPAATSPSAAGVFKSTDEGQTWTRLDAAGLPALRGNNRVFRLAVAAHTNARRVFLAGVGRLMRSDDGGATWTAITTDARPAAERVFVSPNDPDLVYGLHITAYRSRDGGATWEAFKGAPGGDDPHVMWIDPTNPNRILLAGDQGASVSVDGGNTWGSWYNQSTAQVYHISLDSSWPYWVYGQQQDSGAVAVRNRGDLGEIGPLDWYPTPGWESGYIVADPLNPNLLYGNGPDSASQLVRISVPTGQWIHVGPNLDPAQHLGTPGPLVWNPFDEHELLVGYSKVMATPDGGRTWKPMSPDFTTGGRASISALAASHAIKGLLWAGLPRGGVRMTRDHGVTWTDVSIPNTAGTVESIDASHQTAAEAFAAVTTGDNRPHIYRTRDFGKTWAEVVDGLPSDQASGSFVNCVRTDSQRAGLVFAATESSMYVSFDDGDHWQPLRLNLPTTSVRDIVAHDNDLVIATFGRGIWVLDDYSPLRQITSETEQDSAHLFKPGDAVRVRRDINGDTPFPPEIPHFANPPLGAVIYYSLAKAPAGPITIEIVDPEGHVIRHMSSAAVPPISPIVREFPSWWLKAPTPLPTEVGLNRITWDVRYDNPPSDGEHVTIRAVPGDTPMHYEGPLALPGVYTVRLTVDGTAYTQTVRVRNDPRSTATPEDLRAQHGLQMLLYAGARDADAAAKQVEDVRAAAGRIPSTAASGPVAALIKSLSGTALPFDRILASMNHLLEELDSADFAPTGSMTGAYAGACGELRSALAKWQAVQSTELAHANAALTTANASPLPEPPPIALPGCQIAPAR